MRRPAHGDDLLDRKIKRQLVFLADDRKLQRRFPVAHFQKVLAVERDAAAVGSECAVNVLQNGGFAGAVRADQADEAALIHMKGNVVGGIIRARI